MVQPQDTTLIVLSEQSVDVRVASALQSAARALDHADGCRIVALADAPDLKRFVFEADPWSVLAIDVASVAALRDAFAPDAGAFGPDAPFECCGYTFVAVPGFASCLDDSEAKRLAWQRMQVARHPGNPLD